MRPDHLEFAKSPSSDQILRDGPISTANYNEVSDGAQSDDHDDEALPNVAIRRNQAISIADDSPTASENEEYEEYEEEQYDPDYI